MRRKLITTVGTVACATAIVATISVGIASASPGKRLGETLVVIQSPPRQQYIDLGTPGPSPGDLLIFASTLANQGGTTIGDLHIGCTLNFGQGKLSVDASPVFPNPTVGMVTGGTGEFENARGEVNLDPQPDGTTRVTFDLLGVGA